MYKRCKVIDQRENSPGVFIMTLDVGAIAEETMPGQFVMIKCWNGSEPFLMRPISVNDLNRKDGKMTLLYTIKGSGTRLLSELKAGDEAEILAPLGSSFPIIEGAKRVALIGRGIGIAPLLLLAKDYKEQGAEIYVYLSAKEENHLFNREEFQNLGAKLRFTVNTNEVITDEMINDCENLRLDGDKPFDAAYSCGSNRLARGMQELHKKYDFPAYVSLEQHMACGIGACKGCVCTAKNSDTEEISYPRVCKEGPVFPVDIIYY